MPKRFLLAAPWKRRLSPEVECRLRRADKAVLVVMAVNKHDFSSVFRPIAEVSLSRQITRAGLQLQSRVSPISKSAGIVIRKAIVRAPLVNGPLRRRRSALKARITVCLAMAGTVNAN
jgi:hypothetical protein